MDSTNKKSGFSIKGRIDTQVHNEEDLKEAADDYESFSTEEKLELARSVEAEYEDTVFNVTTDRFHEYFVDNLDTGQSAAKDNINVSWLALGTNGGGGTSTSDTDLNTRVYERSVTDVADNGKDLLVSTFLDSTEGNGNTFDELGLFSGDPNNLGDNDVFMLNHASFNAVTKDSTKTVTFDVTLTFSDV